MDVPARTLPVPSTVSPQVQVIVQEPISANWKVLPKTADEWKALVTAGAALAVSRLPAIRDRLRDEIRARGHRWGESAHPHSRDHSV